MLLAFTAPMPTYYFMKSCHALGMAELCSSAITSALQHAPIALQMMGKNELDVKAEGE